jgi:hypothetical protein
MLAKIKVCHAYILWIVNFCTWLLMNLPNAMILICAEGWCYQTGAC